MHAFEDTLRMQQTGRQWLGIVRWGKTKHIGVEEQAATQAGAKGITVDPQNAGDGAAIWVESAWRIMRFDLHDQIPLVVEFDHASVVVKDGEEPIDALADLLGGAHHIAFEEAVNRRPLPLGI